MKTRALSQGLTKLGARLALGAALLSLWLANPAAGRLAAQAAPAPAASTAGRASQPDHPTRSAPALVSGTACAPGCDLYATTGTLTLPDGQTAPIWGYSSSSAAGSASLPGPVLVVNQGEAAAITLHNVDLPSATSLMIAGQPGIPDVSGVTSGNAVTYNFPATGPLALQPGTYLYEAGLTANGPRQVAMGLHGALIVRPAGSPNQAYDAGTAFDDEAVLVLSEIDPALNAAPLTFEMSSYAPTYWLINGKGYPNTDVINTAPGHKVLLRYVNAGLKHHSMAVLGTHQTIVAIDASLSANPLRVVAETVPTGGTLDTLVSAPANVLGGTRYALLDAAMHADNSGELSTAANPNPAYTPIAFGGMLTFIVSSGGSIGSVPATTNVAVAPNPTNGQAPVTLTANISNYPDQAEYFVDTLGGDGLGCPITIPLAGSVVTATIPVTGATAPCVDLMALASGSHTFYVHGHNIYGWGLVASAVLNLDKAGPEISGLLLTPSLTNGSADVQLQATGSDADTGNQNVTAAEYTLNGGPAVPITITVPATDVSLNAVIPAATLAALPDGSYPISLRAQDALGNWGAFDVTSTITLTVDQTGPAAGNIVLSPNPTNGQTGVQIGSGGAFYERLDAVVTDTVSGTVNSKIMAAEYFIDTQGAAGTGGAMMSTDGVYNSTSEHVFAAIDLYAIAALANGPHTVYVCGKDAAGNWGPCATATLNVDRTGPTVSAVTLAPPASNRNTAVAVGVAASDVASGNSNITNGEYFIDTAGAAGTGTLITATTPAPETTITGTIPTSALTGLSAGNHVVYARARDAVGNWSTAVVSTTLLIDLTPPTFTGLTLTPNSISVGTASVALTVTGATDPLVGGLASGVVGGEYWFDGSTNLAAGSGTAFTGLTNVPINTSALTIGNHNVRVRVRDAAGNWSTGFNGVHSAQLTVTVPQANLSISKTDGVDTVNPGDTIQYTIVVTNAGPNAAPGAPVTDTVPVALANVSWTCGGGTGGATCDVPSGAGNISTTVNLPAGGTLTFMLSGTLSSTAVGQLRNSAYVTVPVGMADPDTHNSATDIDTISPQAPGSAVLDDFNRTIANNLGANWSQSGGGTAALRVGNLAGGISTGYAYANSTGNAYWTTPFSVTESAGFTFIGATAPISGSSLILRASNSGGSSPSTYIRVRYQTNAGGQVVVETTTGASFSTRGTLNAISAFASGDTLSAATYTSGSGSNTSYAVYVYQNGALIGVVTWTTGSLSGLGNRIGMQLPAGQWVDDFNGGGITGTFVVYLPTQVQPVADEIYTIFLPFVRH